MKTWPWVSLSAVAIAAFLFSTRYTISTSGNLRMNKWTGETWLRSGLTWHPIGEIKREDMKPFTAADFEDKPQPVPGGRFLDDDEKGK